MWFPNASMQGSMSCWSTCSTPSQPRILPMISIPTIEDTRRWRINGTRPSNRRRKRAGSRTPFRSVAGVYTLILHDESNMCDMFSMPEPAWSKKIADSDLESFIFSPFRRDFPVLSQTRIVPQRPPYPSISISLPPPVRQP